ncbi:DUF4232 domain-containing protein [Streptomyces morookaense]|uniref:DUF4232 domain-containing protein n=1 Tax=Streptomyces morookaense TaxID=1970 RepID=UPI0033F55B0A
MPSTARFAASAALAVTAALATTACQGQGSGARLGPAPATEAQAARMQGVPVCSAAAGRLTVGAVRRTAHHLLLTFTNTGSARCVVHGRPRLRFDEGEPVTRDLPGSRPPAEVALAPGQSAYAAVRAAAGARPAHFLTVSVQWANAAPARLALPEGTSADGSAAVSSWQATPGDALMS